MVDRFRCCGFDKPLHDPTIHGLIYMENRFVPSKETRRRLVKRIEHALGTDLPRQDRHMSAVALYRKYMEQVLSFEEFIMGRPRVRASDEMIFNLLSDAVESTDYPDIGDLRAFVSHPGVKVPVQAVVAFLTTLYARLQRVYVDLMTVASLPFSGYKCQPCTVDDISWGRPRQGYTYPYLCVRICCGRSWRYVDISVEVCESDYDDLIIGTLLEELYSHKDPRQTVLLALHPRAGRDSALRRAFEGPLGDLNVMRLMLTF